MCNQFILASVGSIAIAGSAFAAEPAPVPPPPVPVFTWSGVYPAARSVTPGVKTMFLGSVPPMILIQPPVSLAWVNKGSSAAPMWATISSLTHGSWPVLKRPWMARAYAKRSMPQWRTSRRHLREHDFQFECGCPGLSPRPPWHCMGPGPAVWRGWRRCNELQHQLFRYDRILHRRSWYQRDNLQYSRGLHFWRRYRICRHRQLVGASGIPAFELRPCLGLSVRQSEQLCAPSRRLCCSATLSDRGPGASRV